MLVYKWFAAEAIKKSPSLYTEHMRSYNRTILTRTFYDGYGVVGEYVVGAFVD